MILEFSTLKEDEEEQFRNEVTNSKSRKKKEFFLTIKNNIIDLFLVNNDLNTKGKIIQKSNSESNLNKMKKHLKHKNKRNKLVSHIKNDNYNDNLNIQEEKNKIINENNNYYLKGKNEINMLKNNNAFNSHNFEKTEKIPQNHNQILNIFNQNNSINEMDSFNNNINLNSDKNIQQIQNKENSNNNIINSPSFPLEDNSSMNSSKNDNSKNNNRKSFYSSSSFGKNFILKNNVCKSTKNNENKYNKNNVSDDNPIMTYYMGNNFGNFYLFNDKKSQDELDGNQYLNFFPMDEKKMKAKEKDIMSCIYIDNKTSNNKDDITKELINMNKDNKEQNNLFNLKDFDSDESLNKNKGQIPPRIEKNDEKIRLDKINFNNDFIKDNLFGSNINHNNENVLNNDNNNVLINGNFDSNNLIDNNNNQSLNINNNNPFENISNSDIINKLSIQKNYEKKQEENNFEFPMSKRNNKSNNDNFNNNNNIEDIINNINLNEFKDIKIPLSLENSTFNLNEANLTEFKLNPDILDELSNLNKNMNMDDKFFSKQNYYPPADNLFSQKKGINEMDLNNFNVDFNFNYFQEGLNRMNMLPLNKSFYDYTDDELIQYSIPLIKDQSGCRFLQDKIKSNQYFANEKLLPQIKNNLKELCCDPFGNYFLQVLIDTLSYENMNIFLDLIQKDFKDICICPHGTRVMQKMIEKIYNIPVLMNKFISYLNSKELGIIFKSPYGNHIMQKFLETIHSPEYTQFIYKFTFDNFMEIAKTKHGVCVIQKCVSEGNENERKKIYDLILKNFDILIKDQFGNYLIQYILINTKTKEKFIEIFPLVQKIEGNLLDYCKSEFSANVIEKCFENNDNFIREHILEYLLNHYKDKIIEILLDQYGIYIIQKAIKLNTIYKKKLCDIINQKENELKNIDLNDFKYRGILKIINSNKELGIIFSKSKGNDMNNINNNYNNSNYYNYNGHYNYNNNEAENRNSNRGKNNKRGRKYHRGNKFNNK